MKCSFRTWLASAAPRKALKILAVPAAIIGLTALIAGSRSLTLAQTATVEATAEATISTGATTTQIVAAATAFVASLDDTQRSEVLFAFDDTAQRANWSNFPTGLYTRAGLSYASLSDDQRTAVMTLLKDALSEQGYQKVMNIMTGDEVLLQSGEGASVPNASFGIGQYYVSILGTPSETDPWILQWGGHHLALNITFSGANEVLTPSHTGCQPCTYIINDQQVAVLGDEYAKALKLVNALDTTQQATAILDYSVTDLVDGPGEEDRVLTPEGLPGSSMTSDQQAMLMDLVNEWVGIAPDAAAKTRMTELETHINETYFAWSGDITDTSTAYFRVTGPTLLIEFAPQSLGCNTGTGSGGSGGTGGPDRTPPAGGFGGSDQATERATNPTAASTLEVNLGTFSVVNDAGTLCHVHTIYRDPTNAYGAALTAAS